ncbi:MAG: hypothetical protein ACE5EE_06055 [Fidelibacterota bacterium]
MPLHSFRQGRNVSDGAELCTADNFTVLESAMFHKLTELDIKKTFNTYSVQSPAPYPDTLPDTVTPFPTGLVFLITGQAGQVALAIYYD